MTMEIIPRLRPTVYWPSGRMPSCAEKHRTDEKRPACQDLDTRATREPAHGGR